MQSAEAETMQLRKERDQLHARVVKAEAGVEGAQAELQKTAKALERAQEGLLYANAEGKTRAKNL